MNFFEQQEHARRQTRMLVRLFALAVLAIVLAVNFVMALLWILIQGQPWSGAHHYPHGFFLTNTVVTVILICGGTLIETFNLRDGGDAVARMAGGRMVALNTSDIHERRLLNVVEEMALASGIACPRVYLLDKEESINAFAAGYNPNEAVVAVTRGTLTRLTRDELQGVVGHEFSHILNGDMRLNLKLLGVLFGIEMVGDFGRKTMEFVLYSSDDSVTVRKITVFHIAALAFGVTFFVIGYIGLFFGRLIKSAVSRQREFLADASAVQFTRNPDGLGNALRKIGGLSRKSFSGAYIEHRNAEQLSHLFLSAVRPNLMAGLFATHPPLRERLRRIYGRDVALLDAQEMPAEDVVFPVPTGSLPDIAYAASSLAEMKSDLLASTDAIAATAAQAYGGALAKIRLCPEIDQAVHDPYAAPLLVYALLLGPEREQSPQRQCLSEYLPQQAAKVAQFAAAIARLPADARLPLLDLMMPALRQLPITARDAMLAQVQRMIASDQRVSLNEFVLQTVLVRRLAVQANRAVRVKYSAVTELKPECHVLFSLVAHVAAPLLQQSAQSLFIRAADFSPALFLVKTDLIEIAALSYGRIKTALDKANQLAPLANPALIKSLLAIAGEQSPLPLPLADLLRAICAAIEAPMPAAVAAVYTASGWPDASLS
ncbi:M48 family metallopeptidase [Herminiimonas fonticola]|uniref:Zn-dependent protease with chaperone function n=1 Tax=Herminiimonas fonticola TaxID=303380 RepID=A0A4R6GF45_9BURK|nr:M48 family metallopeptidase [Herminiimonas fonticola]RBA24392.1 Peptidase family M48 [Herminiimonas fonticola]TDN93509.1 Zn-dependent protease with chaperone function [Herminiimonas fonticola]